MIRTQTYQVKNGVKIQKNQKRTHSSKSIALSNNGNWNSWEENREFGSQNNLLNVHQHVF